MEKSEPSFFGPRFTNLYMGVCKTKSRKRGHVQERSNFDQNTYKRAHHTETCFHIRALVLEPRFLGLGFFTYTMLCNFRRRLFWQEKNYGVGFFVETNTVTHFFHSFEVRNVKISKNLCQIFCF